MIRAISLTEHAELYEERQRLTAALQAEQSDNASKFGVLRKGILLHNVNRHYCAVRQLRLKLDSARIDTLMQWGI